MEVERGDPRIVMDPPVTLLIVSEHGRGGVRCSWLGLLFSYLVTLGEKKGRVAEEGLRFCTKAQPYTTEGLRFYKRHSPYD